LSQIATVATTRESNVPSISSFLRKLSSPLEIKVEEDSTATISTLEKSLLKQLVKASYVSSKDTSSLASASLRARQEGRLIIVELEEAPEGPMAAALSAANRDTDTGNKPINKQQTCLILISVYSYFLFPAASPGWTACSLLAPTDNISAVISGGMKAARSRDAGAMIGGDEPLALAAYWKSSATALSHAAFLMQVSSHGAARFRVVLLKLE
jgi:hypothetical protein